MSRALVLRPEPGNARTVERLRALGIASVALPLFHVEPVAWAAPPPGDFDVLLLTSANAARHAGPALARYAALPVVAVGSATAAAARHAGLTVADVGQSDAAALADLVAGRRALHLAGAHRRALPGVTAVTVYESVAFSPDPAQLRLADGGVALLHSPRAAARFAELVPPADRTRIAVAALSPVVADAAGTGWRAVAAAGEPRDAALVALAAAMIDRTGADADKPVL